MKTRIPLSQADEQARLKTQRLNLSIAEMGLSGSNHQLPGRNRDFYGS